MVHQLAVWVPSRPKAEPLDEPPLAPYDWNVHSAEQLGEGAFARVLKCRVVSLNGRSRASTAQVVAIKQLKGNLTDPADAWKCFAQEANLLARIQHP
jgi:serine/threonine protein kinase